MGDGEIGSCLVMGRAENHISADALRFLVLSVLPVDRGAFRKNFLHPNRSYSGSVCCLTSVILSDPLIQVGSILFPGNGSPPTISFPRGVSTLWTLLFVKWSIKLIWVQQLWVSMAPRATGSIHWGELCRVTPCLIPWLWIHGDPAKGDLLWPCFLPLPRRHPSFCAHHGVSVPSFLYMLFLLPGTHAYLLLLAWWSPMNLYNPDHISCHHSANLYWSARPGRHRGAENRLSPAPRGITVTLWETPCFQVPASALFPTGMSVSVSVLAHVCYTWLQVCVYT